MNKLLFKIRIFTNFKNPTKFIIFIISVYYYFLIFTFTFSILHNKIK